MPANVLISRLDGVKQTGKGRWIAKCPAHDDSSPSLAVREVDDGRVLVHCFAGCQTDDVLAAVGLQFLDLFPDTRISHRERRIRQRFNYGELLQMVSREVLVVALAAEDISEGKTLTEQDHARLVDAAARIRGVANVNR